MTIFLDKQRPPKKKMGRLQRTGSKSNPSTGVQWANWLDNPAGAPGGGGGGGGIPAAGATAGTPGTFTPAGCVVPANLVSMTPVAASPTTAWTTGQHVVLGDASTAHWSGTAWVAGAAAVEDPETQGAPTSSWLKADIIEWLTTEGGYEEEGLDTYTKAELLELVED